MRFVKYFIIILFLFALVTIAAPIGLVIYTLESTPLVVGQQELLPKDIGRAKKLIKQNDPRTLKDGTVKSVTMLERDVNLILDYGLIAYKDKLSVQVDVQDNSSTVVLTAKVPDNPLGTYLNVKAALAPEKKFMTFQQISIGKLKLPGSILTKAIAISSSYLGNYQKVQPFLKAIESIQNVQMKNDQLTVTFRWSQQVAEDVKNQARDLVISDANKERLLYYYQKISDITYQQSGDKASLASYLKTLFSLAHSRSRNSGDPVAENRALIISLSCFNIGISPVSIVGSTNPDLQIKPRKIHLSLLGRQDLPKHFMVSAVIAATADSTLSNVVGVFKEIEDSKGGSGFSFPDLAADRAGVKLAELATGSKQQALSFQRRMSTIQDEYAFMPRIDQLPEGLMELEFKKKFRDLNSQQYKLVEDEIQRRIAACFAFQK